MNLLRTDFAYIAFIAVFTAAILFKKSDELILKLTNFKCISLDESYMKFRYCDLKVMGRGKIAANVHIEVYKPLVSNITINTQLLKKLSGYRPFLYNDSTDFCHTLLQRKRLSFFNIVFNALEKTSNLNHSCPYNHDIIVKEFVLEKEHFRLIPLPSGDYLLYIKVAIYNHFIADIKIYVEIVEN